MNTGRIANLNNSATGAKQAVRRLALLPDSKRISIQSGKSARGTFAEVRLKPSAIRWYPRTGVQSVAVSRSLRALCV